MVSMASMAFAVLASMASIAPTVSRAWAVLASRPTMVVASRVSMASMASTTLASAALALAVLAPALVASAGLASSLLAGAAVACGMLSWTVTSARCCPSTVRDCAVPGWACASWRAAFRSARLNLMIASDPGPVGWVAPSGPVAPPVAPRGPAPQPRALVPPRLQRLKRSQALDRSQLRPGCRGWTCLRWRARSRLQCRVPPQPRRLPGAGFIPQPRQPARPGPPPWHQPPHGPWRPARLRGW